MIRVAVVHVGYRKWKGLLGRPRDNTFIWKCPHHHYSSEAAAKCAKRELEKMNQQEGGAA